MSSTLTNGQCEVLEALAVHRYLTAQQFVDLGVSKSVESVQQRMLNPLIRRRPVLVKWFNFGLWRNVRTLPYVYVLTDKGALAADELLDLPPGTTRYPKTKGSFAKEFFHRKAIIDFHIRFRLWAAEINADVPIAALDFDRSLKSPAGQPRKDTFIANATKNGSCIVPDAVFVVALDEHVRPYVLEVHYDPSPKKIVDQLLGHAEAMENGAVAARFDLNVSHFLVSLHQSRATMMTVMDRLSKEEKFRPFLKGFLFNEIGNIAADLSGGWLFADGTTANPFPVRSRFTRDRGHPETSCAR